MFFYSWSLEELKNDLKSADIVTVSWNAYNHDHMMLLHIVVSYFQGYGFDTMINNEILTFVEVSGEPVNIVSARMMKAVASYDLGTKVIG
jgi:hypothetical protein